MTSLFSRLPKAFDGAQNPASQRAVPDFFVFSHLRWQSIFQRPHHLMTYFSASRHIYFIEEGMPEAGRATKISHPEENITVITPGFGWEAGSREYSQLILQNLSVQKDREPVLWFYSPMFAEVIPHIQHSLVVYDCMDELANFKFAPPRLMELEKYLMANADIVFTGGKSLYEHKKTLHENIYCFPSSVDEKHFARAKSPDLPVPMEILNRKRPVLLYYGAIDERIDLDLIKNVAGNNPDFSFVFIGPVVKISGDDLPRGKNLHWLGPKKYSELPGYLKACDIAFMPFAANESTKFISPTKTLEFLAAGKPVISTPVADVVRDYRDVVRIINSPEDFKRAVFRILYESELQKNERQKKVGIILSKTSWSRTAEIMDEIIRKTLAGKMYAMHTRKPYRVPENTREMEAAL